MLKDYPQWRQPTHGRVFAMQEEEANPDTTLLTGNILIKRVAMKALIDSGTTHSFILETFANHLDVKSIGFNGHLVYVDLIVLPMPGFDIILGMDWVTKNIVLIEFHKRSVLVRPLGMEQFLFEPDRWESFLRVISCMQARRLIHKGCQAFLASIVSALDVANPSISDIPVVKDFPDVFPDDITGLPLGREVEFSIDLVPGTVLLSSS
ncbi:uncharacterized protein [Primulina eburnea]|uniref:uncharacterized protein n=1 Tax=Primulina eburnea TaxID=1245227 RepID=UPI003C6C840C